MVEAYARQWLDAQTFDESTREAMALRLRLHIHPALGRLPLAQVKPSTVQAWLRGLDRLAPSYQRLILRNLPTIMLAAVEDGLIAKNPSRARSVRAPRDEGRKVIPWRSIRCSAYARRYRPGIRSSPRSALASVSGRARSSAFRSRALTSCAARCTSGDR